MPDHGALRTVEELSNDLVANVLAVMPLEDGNSADVSIAGVPPIE